MPGKHPVNDHTSHSQSTSEDDQEQCAGQDLLAVIPPPVAVDALAPHEPDDDRNERYSEATNDEAEERERQLDQDVDH